MTFFETEDKYSGYWLIDKREGLGYRHNNDYAFFGDWKNNMRTGPGKIKFNNGDFFEGTWFRGEVKGRGRIGFS